MISRLLCLLGRHQWSYAITKSDEVLRCCKRCMSLRAIDIFPTHRLGTVPVDVGKSAPDRPRPDLDNDLDRRVIALLKAICNQDAEAIVALAPFADSLPLLVSLGQLTGDALAEPSSDDLIAYADRLFDSINRSPR